MVMLMVMYADLGLVRKYGSRCHEPIKFHILAILNSCFAPGAQPAWVFVEWAPQPMFNTALDAGQPP